jgi:hypothetical protein
MRPKKKEDAMQKKEASEAKKMVTAEKSELTWKRWLFEKGNGRKPK